jgi:enoyl-[acyl-carrier protein] reductase II
MLLSPFADQVAETAAEEKVAVITTGAGNPSRYMKRWSEAGIRVIPVVASVAMAKLVTRAGAAAVIAEGGESGGHVGETSTMALLPQVCDATSLPCWRRAGLPTEGEWRPHYYAGRAGRSAGHPFLGGRGVPGPPELQRKSNQGNDIATMTTGKRLGHPVRSLKTPFSRAYLKAEYSGISDEELEAMGVGTLRLAAVEGDNERGCFLCGQAAGLVKKQQPAAEIIREIFTEAEAILNGAGNG